MNINWVLSDSAIIDPTVDISRLKDIGSFWGSWQTWRGCQTDNVICHEMSKVDELIKRAFHSVCNFYISNSVYQSLNRPLGVKIYEGDFIHDVDHQEEIIAMHLAASNSEIVLLFGFDFSEKPVLEDKLLEHRATNYYNLIKQVIKDNALIQWVLVDHPKPLKPDFAVLDNLTKDTMSNVLKLLD